MQDDIKSVKHSQAMILIAVPKILDAFGPSSTLLGLALLCWCD
jgi:hypothetical protein